MPAIDSIASARSDIMAREDVPLEIRDRAVDLFDKLNAFQNLMLAPFIAGVVAAIVWIAFQFQPHSNYYHGIATLFYGLVFWFVVSRKVTKIALSWPKKRILKTIREMSVGVEAEQALDIIRQDTFTGMYLKDTEKYLQTLRSA